MKERTYKTHFVDWRKQLHTNQEKYAYHQNVQFLTRLPLTLTPGMTTSLLMLMMIGGVITQELNSPKIAELAKQKMISDKSIPSEKLEKDSNCERILQAISKTAKKLPVSEAPIRRVLTHPESKIICTTHNEIAAIMSNAKTSAFFDADSKAIYLSSDALNPGLIYHEFIHADTFFRHQTKSCNEDKKVEATLPIFPSTKENIAKYQKALDRGDNRIRTFKQLWMKEIKHLKLTAEEKKTLEKYKEASRNCLMPVTQDINPPTTYQALLDMGWYPNKKGFTVTNSEGITMLIMEVKRTPQATIITMEAATPAFSIFNILDKIKEKLGGSYKNLSEKIKLIERDAFTFEHMSEEAAKVFYPEATALRNKDIEKCLTSENQTISEKVEL